MHVDEEVVSILRSNLKPKHQQQLQRTRKKKRTRSRDESSKNTVATTTNVQGGLSSLDDSSDQFYLLCSTMDQNNCSSHLRFVKSPKVNLSNKTSGMTAGCCSILSTAESHLTNRLKHVTRRELHIMAPKANSSPRPAASRHHRGSGAGLNQSMTFAVDYASTPKKNQPRASTPSLSSSASKRRQPRQQQQHTQVHTPTCPLHHHHRHQHQQQQQQHSTMMTSSSPMPHIRKQLQHASAKKTIPPPLLSSSMAMIKQPPAQQSNSIEMSSKIARKRKRCAAAVEEQCSRCCSCTQARNLAPTTTQHSGSSEMKWRRSESKKLRPSSQRRVSFDTNPAQHQHAAKYPIRFMLDRRTQDIDRCNQIDDALLSCDFKPFLKSCYAFGDYNVWIL